MNTEKCEIIKVSKSNGKHRTIYAPMPEYKSSLRELVGRLERKVRTHDRDNVIHGFVRYRSPATNALAHVGHAYTLSIDLQDFFDHVDATKCSGVLSNDEAALVLVDGVARQGLPTSPSVANLAFMSADKAILKFIRKSSKNIVYTRYADDLTFSFDEPGLETTLLPKLREIVSRSGFRINESKTQLQSAAAGRRIITGYGVDDAGIHPTRAIKRKLRAALHQKKDNAARGLAEWCKCKMPREPRARVTEDQADDFAKLLRGWKLGRLSIKDVPNRVTEDLGGGVVISGDPCLFLGMSTFTTGWTSCMRQPHGQYRKGVKFWVQLAGTRVAYIAKPGDMIAYHGVERPRMQARCLVHTLRNGTLVFDRLYGNEGAMKALVSSLRSRGAISIAEARRTMMGEKVVGRVRASGAKPYFDSLRSSNLMHNGREVIVATI